MLNITNITPPRVPLTDQRTGLISREWYRFFLNIFELVGQGTNNVSLEEIQYGPPSLPVEALTIDPNAPANAPNDSPLLSQLDEITKQIQALQSVPSDLAEQIAVLQTQIQALAVEPPTTPQLHRTAYGSFYDTNTQTAAAINTAYGMTFNTTDLTNGVVLGSPTSRVYVDRANVYNIQFSAQLDKSSASKGDVYIWLRYNGTDVASSATQVTLGGSNAATVAAWNFLLSMNAGDYFELMWSTNDTACVIKAATASSPAPAIPSIILTVTDNIRANQY